MAVVAMKSPGQHMTVEIAEVPGVFVRSARQAVPIAPTEAGFGNARAIYTIARGSSDAAALILAYEFMARLRVPVTSLPPSVFSIGPGVDLTNAHALVISQSGASDDLVRSVTGARARGAKTFAITNVAGSNVEASADVTVSIGAGPEQAVPATKTVVGSIAAGMALLAAIDPDYGAERDRAVRVFEGLAADAALPEGPKLASALLRAQHVYVIGRGTGFGAAQEVALKLKETCALHAEAYSASEVLHGPLQLVSKQLTVLILDTGEPAMQPSLDEADARFCAAGASVFRVRSTDMGVDRMTPAGAAAMLLYALYPVVLSAALSLGYDPDTPANLAKVTRTA